MLRSQWYGRTTGAQLLFADHADKVGRQRAAAGVPAEATAVAAGATPREGEQRMRLGGAWGGAALTLPQNTQVKRACCETSIFLICLRTDAP